MKISLRKRSNHLSLFLLLVLLTPAWIAPFASFTHDIAGETSGQPIVWAKPLAGGAIRALFIAPRFTLGDVAELDARLDMRYETVALWDTSNLGYDPMAFTVLPEGGSREEVLDRLKRSLRNRWDVIVLANFDAHLLPEEILSDILDKVAGGTGLVTAHLHDGDESPFRTILQTLEEDSEALPIGLGIAECAFPGFGGLDDIGKVLSHEKGRVVALEYPGDPPRNHCIIQTPADPVDMDAAYKDNAYSLAIRALCLAAGRTNAVRIQSVRDIAPSGPDDLEIPPDLYPEFVQAMRDSVVAQPSRPFQLTLDKPADQGYSVHAQLRRVDSDIQVIYRDTSLLARGASAHRFEIPVGPGAYMLDVWIQTRRGIADWFTADLTIPGWPEFHNLALEKNWLMPNDSLEITLDVRPVAGPNREGALYARAQDGFGRIVADAVQEVSNQGGALTLRLHLSDLLSSLVRLEVFAVDGKARSFSEWELHCSYREVRYLSVRQRPDALNLELVAATEEPREYGTVHFLSTLAATGVHALHAPAGEATIVAAARSRLDLVPELTRVAVDHAQDGLYRSPCLLDPGYRGRMEIPLREDTLRHWAGASTRYSLGNLNSLSASEENLCQCRHCLGAFQTMLQAAYTDISALNRAWQQDFGDWDFVEPPPSMAPGHDGPPAPWVDFRVFMDNQFAGFHGWARGHVAAADAAAHVGARFSSDANPYRGFHWPSLFEALDFVTADYSPLWMDKLRSYRRPNSWCGVALADARAVKDGSLSAWLPWHLACRQVPALWIDTVWGDAAHPAPEAWLRPDGSATPELEQLSRAVATVRDGAGPLLFAATAAPPKIAVYDSHASRHFCAVNTDYNTAFSESQEAAAQLLRLAGHNYKFVSKNDLTRAAPLPHAALVLPRCQALDEEERNALRAFVEAGGALIADVLPGRFDAHGQPDGHTRLDDLFGVQTNGAPQVAILTLQADGLAGDARDAGWAAVDRSLGLVGGVAMARAEDAPAWIINRHGLGHTLLLNHPFRAVQHQDRRRLVPAEWQAMTLFLQDLPELNNGAGTLPEAFPGDLFRYTLGDAEVFAMLTDMDAPRQDVRLPLESGDIVYNALTGERIRRPHRHRFRIAPGGIEIVTRLPYEVKTLQVDAPEVGYTGQRLPIRIMVLPTEGKPGRHLFLVDLIPVNRPPVPWFRRTINAETGYAELYLPLAINEALGRYALRVRDSLTGMESTASLKISSPIE